MQRGCLRGTFQFITHIIIIIIHFESTAMLQAKEYLNIIPDVEMFEEHQRQDLDRQHYRTNRVQNHGTGTILNETDIRCLILNSALFKNLTNHSIPKTQLIAIGYELQTLIINTKCRIRV